MYLFVTLDCHSHRIIGYYLPHHLDTSLTLTALRMAMNDRCPLPGCIHHSDQAVQYTSSNYVNELKTHDFKVSMAKRKNPYDNAVCESFIKTLKRDEVCLLGYASIEEAQAKITNFIDDVYDAKRPHSSLYYRPSNEFEEFIREKNKNNSTPPAHSNLICPMAGAHPKPDPNNSYVNILVVLGTD